MVKFSLVIPTIGRTIQLNDLLESIKQSKYKDIEVIIVDQNEDDRLDFIIAKYRDDFSILHEKVCFKGATKARNYGFEKSTGSYVMFPDDDCEFFADTLTIVDKLIEKIKPDVITGRSVDRDGRDSVCSFSKNSCFLNEKNHQGKYVEFSEIFSRKIFEQFKYDENIGVGNFYGSGEAFDQMIRMLRNGVKVYYSPEICFYHPVKTPEHTSPSELRRAFFYACGFAYVCKKNNVKDAKKRLHKVLIYIPFCLCFKRKLAPYYKAELAGLLAGMYVES